MPSPLAHQAVDLLAVLLDPFLKRPGGTHAAQKALLLHLPHALALQFRGGCGHPVSTSRRLNRPADNAGEREAVDPIRKVDRVDTPIYLRPVDPECRVEDPQLASHQLVEVADVSRVGDQDDLGDTCDRLCESLDLLPPGGELADANVPRAEHHHGKGAA